MSGKGFLYTLEVLIAVSVMFVIIIYLFRMPTVVSHYDESVIIRQGIYAIKYLDDTHDLRKWAYENNEGPIEEEIKDLLPANIGFESEICRNVCTRRNVPSGKTIYVIDYYTSYYKNNYIGEKIRLYLWVL